MTRDRKARLRRLQAALERRASPRLEMALIALGTGASGFLLSFALLHLGLERMWLRYLIAFLLAYGVFFVFVRFWLHLYGRRIRDKDLQVPVPDPADVMSVPDLAMSARTPGNPGFVGGGGRFGGAGASGVMAGGRPAGPPVQSARGDGSSILGDWVTDDSAIPLVLLAAVAGALLASAWVVYSAPSLLAELLVDGILVGGLYRRLRHKSAGHWLSIALRRTAIPFAVTCLLFVFAGWFVQTRLPDVRSIGDVLRHLAAH